MDQQNESEFGAGAGFGRGDLTIDELLKDHQHFHSEFQMDWLITVRAGGTEFGCYQQALRELFDRWKVCKELAFQRRRLLIEIERLKLQGPGDQFKELLRDVEVEEKRFSLQILDRSLSHAKRERDHFLRQAQLLKLRIGELTPDKRRQLEWEKWEHNLKCMAAVDFASCGRLRENTITFLSSLPLTVRSRLADILLNPKRHQELLDWYASYEPGGLKAIDGAAYPTLLEIAD